MIRGIAFDLFDTLVDQNHDRLQPVDVGGLRVSPTTPALFRALEGAFVEGTSMSLESFAAKQRDIDRDLFRRTLKEGVELPTVERFGALLAELPLRDASAREALAAELTAVHMGMLREAVTVPIHHEAVLSALAVDYELALCSNFSDGPTARAILDESGFAPHLDAVLISEETGLRKPRWEIFAAVSDSLGIEPDEILHVGDSLSADIAGAAAVGMKTVWITRQIADPDALLAEYDGPRPDFALEDLVDLPVLAARLAV